MKKLTDLYKDHTGKVSDKWRSYLDEYDKLFTPFRSLPISLLEIGIQNGGSLEIWSQYFPNAQKFVGCDINPDCANLSYLDPRIAFVVGDANAEEVKEKVFQHSQSFDLIVDDGSHTSGDIVKAFANYFPALRDGGLFVAEDLHCSYWGEFDGGIYHPHSSINFFKLLADIVNHEHWGLAKTRGDLVAGYKEKFQVNFPENLLAEVGSVKFINSICIIEKKSKNLLGTRVVAGTDSQVVPSVTQMRNSISVPPSEFNNMWSSLVKSPAEAYVENHELIEQLKQKSLVQLAEITRLNNDLKAIQGSKSWRYTAILRNMRNVLSPVIRLIIRIGQVTKRNNGVANLLRKSALILRQEGIVGFINKLIGISQKSRALTMLEYAIAHNKPSRWTWFFSTNKFLNLKSAFVQRGHSFYRSYLRSNRFGRWLANQFINHGFISSMELRASALALSNQSLKEFPESGKGPIEPDAGVPGFHLSPRLNLETVDALANSPRINVLIPSLRLKHMSGGPNTALLIAGLLVEKGERVRLIACDAPAEGEEAALFPHMDGLLQRPVDREKIELIDGFDRERPILIGINDLFFATAWWTAQIAKYGVRQTAAKEFIYLIQDFEPILHEGSTFQARALETYGLPHIPIINTRLLLDHLKKEDAGCYSNAEFAEQALWFEPALDRRYYFSDPGKFGKSGKKTLLFYARPSVARRNLFEIGVVALRQLVASGVIDNDNWEVWAMGEKLSPVALGNDVFLNPLPWMSFEVYAERVRKADLLLSLMLSPHPSYPPLEMAASGKLVVTNSYSVKTAERLKKISPNILVAEPTAESVAAALEKAAGRINVGLSSYDPHGAIELPTSWDESLCGIIPELMRRIHKLRTKPQVSSVPLVSDNTYKIKSGYESYRQASLKRRRRENGYQQESGLLSFVTTAYDTDPLYLKELANSIFSQDGGMQFEWFILDNGSKNEETCNMLQELASHPGVRLVRVEHNLGIIGGMRFCLENATGRYILPLDSDDLVEPDCVHTLTRAIKSNNYPVLLYTDEDKLGNGVFGSHYFKPNWDPVLFLHSCYIAHLCVIDRELGLELGLYSSKTAEGCHDWDSFIRFMEAGYLPHHVPEVLYSWRIHDSSTSGNIASKDYITESHRATLTRMLSNRNANNLELVNSPLFSANVDWCYKRKDKHSISCKSLVINSRLGKRDAVKPQRPNVTIDASNDNCLLQLAKMVSDCDVDFVHFCWDFVTPDDDGFCSEAVALFELFPDAVAVGGTLHDGRNVVGGPVVFGFGNGYDCPDLGRPLADPGYSAQMWKARSVSAVSSAHCVVRSNFLLQTLPILIAEKVGIEMLGPWLGALASEENKGVVFSPFMRAKAAVVPENLASEYSSAKFISRFWSLLMEANFYSSRLGLTYETAYLPVSNLDRDKHFKSLQLRSLTYADWLENNLQRRATKYPVQEAVVSMTVVTPVYHGSNLELLNELANSIVNQTIAVHEWILVINGPMSQASVDLIRSKSADEWNARVIVELEPIGIVASLRLGLQVAQGEYVIVVDADDLITRDAMQILSHEINRLGRPDLIFTDEDLLVEGKPALPNFRAAYDPVLSLDNSNIWHLCALKRDAALAAEVYGDDAANWCQDWDAVSRIYNSGGNIAHVPEVLYHWRQHTGSTTNKAEADSRSLDSVRFILERQIALVAEPKHFYVTEWPLKRGANELYIARCQEDLPQFVWIGDINDSNKIINNENAILIYTSNGVIIESEQVLLEVVRLLELHPQLGMVGGLLEDKNGVIIDACYMVNASGVLESPWLDPAVFQTTPHALALKTQSVSTTGNSMAFIRISALKRVGAWPIVGGEATSDTLMKWCGQLAENGWGIAYSPLVRARAGSTFCREENRTRPPLGVPLVNHALVRYGMYRNFKE